MCVANNPNNCNFVPDLPSWVELALSGFKTLTRVELYTSEGYPIRDYGLQGRTGSVWKTAAAVKDNTSVHIAHVLNDESGSKVV